MDNLMQYLDVTMVCDTIVRADTSLSILLRRDFKYQALQKSSCRRELNVIFRQFPEHVRMRIALDDQWRGQTAEPLVFPLPKRICMIVETASELTLNLRDI